MYLINQILTLMKNLLKMLPFMLLLLLACEKKTDSQSADNQPDGQNANEIIQLEEATQDLEATKQEIEAKTKDLDGLLNEIDQ